MNIPGWMPAFLMICGGGGLHPASLSLWPSNKLCACGLAGQSKKMTFLVGANLISVITVIGRTAVIVMYFSGRRIQCITRTRGFLNCWDASAEVKAPAKKKGFPCRVSPIECEERLVSSTLPLILTVHKTNVWTKKDQFTNKWFLVRCLCPKIINQSTMTNKLDHSDFT